MPCWDGLSTSQLPLPAVRPWTSLSSSSLSFLVCRVDLLIPAFSSSSREVVTKAGILKIKPKTALSNWCYKYQRRNSIIKCPLFIEASGGVVRLRSRTPFLFLSGAFRSVVTRTGRARRTPQRWAVQSALLWLEQACNIPLHAGKNRIARRM